MIPRSANCRDRDQAGLELDMTEHTCSVDGCGLPIKARRWCSKHYQRWIKFGSVFAVQDTGQCVGCGVEVTKGKSGPLPQRCGECRENHLRLQDRKHHAASAARKKEESRNRRREAVKECPRCGVRFSPEKTMSQRFCSRRCSNVSRLDSATRACEAVGCVRPVRARNMCSMHYRRWRRAEGLENPAPWDESRYAAWKKRRDQKISTQVAPIRSREIFERDEWLCGICGGRVDKSLEWPHPMCATIDHIVPLSRGGHHMPENVRLAHARCNVARGNSASG